VGRELEIRYKLGKSCKTTTIKAHSGCHVLLYCNPYNLTVPRRIRYVVSWLSVGVDNTNQ